MSGPEPELGGWAGMLPWWCPHGRPGFRHGSLAGLRRPDSLSGQLLVHNWPGSGAGLPRTPGTDFVAPLMLVAIWAAMWPGRTWAKPTAGTVQPNVAVTAIRRVQDVARAGPWSRARARLPSNSAHPLR